MASLQAREAKPHQHADEAEQIALGHLERLRQDGMEATAIKKEQDELLQRENEALQWALELLSWAKKERKLRLAAEEKLAATESQARQDTATIDCLRKERDDSRQIMSRLCSEDDTVCDEHDQASQECDGA